MKFPRKPGFFKKACRAVVKIARESGLDRTQMKGSFDSFRIIREESGILTQNVTRVKKPSLNAKNGRFLKWVGALTECKIPLNTASY
jgi:hypothetical protein